MGSPEAVLEGQRPKLAEMPDETNYRTAGADPVKYTPMTVAEATPETPSTTPPEVDFLSTPTIERLNPEQQKFLRIYWKDPKRNATAAYKAAGYNWKNDNSARKAAFLLLNSYAIQDALAELRAAVQANLGLDLVWWTKEMLAGVERAKTEKDLTNFFAGMDKLGKHLGVYAKDNKQRAGTDTVESLQAELRQEGFPIEALLKAREN